jgi:hypothetical protein
LLFVVLLYVVRNRANIVFKKRAKILLISKCANSN